MNTHFITTFSGKYLHCTFFVFPLKFYRVFSIIKITERNVCSIFATLTHVYSLSLVHVGQQKGLCWEGAVHMNNEENVKLVLQQVANMDKEEDARFIRQLCVLITRYLNEKRGH